MPQTLRRLAPGGYCKCMLLGFFMAPFWSSRCNAYVRHAQGNEVIHPNPCNETLKQFNREFELSENGNVTRTFLAAGFGMMNDNSIIERAVASLEAERAKSVVI